MDLSHARGAEATRRRDDQLLIHDYMGDKHDTGDVVQYSLIEQVRSPFHRLRANKTWHVMGKHWVN